MPNSSPEKAKVYMKRYRERIKTFITHAKSVPCPDCRGIFLVICMDFDHVRGVKEFNISLGGMSFSRVKKEIEKCDVVCANCHRIRTEKRRLACLLA